MQNNNIDKTKYKVYRQNQLIDNTIKAMLDEKIIDNFGNAVIEMQTSNSSFTLTIENYTQLEGYISKQKYSTGRVNQTVPKLFEVLLIKMSEEGFNSSSIVIPINEYANLIGRNDKSKLRKNTNVDIQILKNTKIKFYMKKDYCCYLCDENTHIEENKIIFVLSGELYNLIKKQRNFLYIPIEVLHTNEKSNPNTYLLYKKILSSKRINCGNEKRENIIKVKELYSYCSTLPRYENVILNGGQVTQRILKPFERDLDVISQFRWTYENSNFKTFDDWLNTKIIIEWLEVIPGLKSVLDGRTKYITEKEYIKEKALIQIEKNKLKKQTNNEVKQD